MTNTEIWQKASYSGGGEGNACVEIAHLGPHIAVRDSKQPTRARITLRASAFAAFVESLKSPVATMEAV